MKDPRKAKVGDLVKFTGLGDSKEEPYIEIKEISHADHGIRNHSEDYCRINGE